MVPNQAVYQTELHPDERFQWESNPLTRVLQTHPRPTRIGTYIDDYRFRLIYHHILSYLLVPVARIELAMHRLKVCCHTTWLHEHMVDNGGFEPQSVPVFKNVPFGCGFRSTTLTQYRSLATADHSDAPLMHQSLPMKRCGGRGADTSRPLATGLITNAAYVPPLPGVVEPVGFEPTTPCLQGRCSSQAEL